VKIFVSPIARIRKKEMVKAEIGKSVEENLRDFFFCLFASSIILRGMKLRVYLALLLLCGLARTSRGDSCDHTFPSGHYFNLQSLRSEYPRTNPALVNVQYMGSNYNYMWAPCDTIPNSVCQGNNVLPNAVMCQKDAGGGTTVHNIGSGPTSWQEGKFITFQAQEHSLSLQVPIR